MSQALPCVIARALPRPPPHLRRIERASICAEVLAKERLAHSGARDAAGRTSQLLSLSDADAELTERCTDPQVRVWGLLAARSKPQRSCRPARHTLDQQGDPQTRLAHRELLRLPPTSAAATAALARTPSPRRPPHPALSQSLGHGKGARPATRGGSLADHTGASRPAKAERRQRRFARHFAQERRRSASRHEPQSQQRQRSGTQR